MLRQVNKAFSFIQVLFTFCRIAVVHSSGCTKVDNLKPFVFNKLYCILYFTGTKFFPFSKVEFPLNASYFDTIVAIVSCKIYDSIEAPIGTA